MEPHIIRTVIIKENSKGLLWSLEEMNVTLSFCWPQKEKRKDRLLAVNPMVSPSETMNWISERLN